MEGKIEITAKKVTEGTEMNVRIQMRDVSTIEKYKIFDAMCEGLGTSLEEMLITKKIVSIFDQVEDKK